MEIDMARSFLAATTFALLALAPASFVPAEAQSAFPTKPIRIILPVPAGSALDVVTRVIGEQLTGNWGQQVVVENRPGALGLIAAQAAAGAQPDGYTLLGGASSIFQILPAQKEKLSLDVNRDFVQIGMILTDSPMYIAVPPSLGIGSFPEFVALARSKPREIIVGTNSAGTLPHFAGLALAKMGNLPITIVPYNSGGTQAAITDVMGGRVHAIIEAAFGLLGQLQSGDLKLIGVMSPERSSLFPEVPTVAATVPGFSAVGFMSLAAPTGTPTQVVQRLSDGLRRALETPTVQRRFTELGVPAKFMAAAETKTFIENQEKFWWPLVRELEAK
jgi:tripartite-type tricarboxylate transporter receptor subunit TctC